MNNWLACVAVVITMLGSSAARSIEQSMVAIGQAAKKSPTIIENNSIWHDTDGEPVWASFGGHISKFGDTYYWVGTDPRKTDSSVRLYSSKTLGSSTWKFEAYVDKRKGGLGRRNCSLLFSPATSKYVVVCKGIGFYQSAGSDINGPYTYVKKITSKDMNLEAYHTGGMSAYSEGDKAYIIISLRKLDKTRDRFALILELTPDFIGLKRLVLFMRVADKREAFWLFKREQKYYMTYDGPGGWMGSDSYYRTADRLEGPWSEEEEIGMIPEPKTRKQRSHASQHRYILNVNGQWIYGGDRYPYQEPESHPPENGLHIILPIYWKEEKPFVIWEKTWDVSNYTGINKSIEAGLVDPQSRPTQ